MKERFDVAGMTCSACSSHVEKSVGKLTGVENVSVNLLTNSMQVEFDENKLDTAGIIKAVEDAGYGAAVKDGHAKSGTKTSGQSDSQENSGLSAVEQNVKNMKKRLIVSLIFWIPLMYVSMGHMIYQWLNIPMPPFTMNFLHGNENAITYAFTQFLLLLPILIANQKYFKNGFKTLWHRSPNMDSLIAIGAGAAILYGIFAIYRIGYAMGHGDMMVVHQYAHDLYFESAGTILTLITIGKYLETKSKGKTSEAITKLLNLAPKTVTVVRDGVEQVVDAADVEKGEIFLVKPGESVAVDGIVLEGKSSFDESAITGESIPVPKQEGDTIVSASINKSGLIRAKATKVGEDTTIAQIIRLVEEASSSKAPIAKMADKIAGVFVPAVITIALITGVIWLISGATFEFAMSTAIAVLVISCPCALGLATPVAIMVGTGKGAENGILIKSGDALETAHQIDTVVLDKTGTITQGKPVVTDIICAAGKNADKTQLLQIAGSLEKGSEHPLAEAIVNYCLTNNISLEKVTDFNALFGKGIEGTVSGTHYYAGNEKMMEEKGISLSTEQKNQIQALAKQGRTPLLFADEKQFLGIVAVADVVKPTSKEAVQKFRDYGIHVIMLTGDNEVTAQAIKEQVGIDEVIAGVLPTQKEEKISALKQAGHKVAMIGDGVNDAPALASADVGIAIGAGTDVAIESADIVLMKNDLLDAVGAVKLSKAVIRNIKENLFWAFFYNSIGIPLAAGVLYPLFQIKLNPMFGAAAMSLSSVCVVSNALRLRWVKLHDAKKTQSEPHQDVAASTIADINQHNALDNNIKSTNNDKGESTMTTTISIEGMMCAHCQAHVEKALKEVAGVTEVTVSLENKNAVVTGDASVEALKQAVVDAGYEVTDVK
ncbi:heavy metal translocating P-type ATPase [Roseburia inulinivorans]|jgi:Cu+-exporting ATPase|uniref:Copper-exporting P-type ATPase n=1 Tax=Roseburia inulinivorans TaxID=360807 RepID=A0A3R6CH33_9FIRM|nr:heavy metal translocating P-type ATPase [Roseburia inulinivorans]RGR65471.1 heavy metal translocating P-type ATPase [Roseburia inulinivorans]